MLSNPFLEHLTDTLSRHAGRRVTLQRHSARAGGDISDAYLLQTTEGPYFLKVHTRADPRLFLREREGLELLAATRTLTVPRPLETGAWNGHAYLLLEYIPAGIRGPRFWQQLGAGLAALHRHTAPTFGLETDNFIGTLPQVNTPAADWATFYARCRILPLVGRAVEEGKCSAADLRLAERLCGRLPQLFPTAPPALLHGDLWSGNFLATAEGQPAVFDPAVYYGHREMDLGMSLLFGGFDAAFYHHYQEAWPLAPGWRERVPLTQLYPLLVHLLLFGGGYYRQVKEILKRFGG